VLDARRMADVEWATWTAQIGWPVAGIQPHLSDGTDIRKVARSHAQELLATVDEFGKLNIFSHPAAVDGSACHVGVAHAGHVSGVAWSSDDSRVLTIGGADMTVMQWKVNKPA
jgi:WD40 repeat protein